MDINNINLFNLNFSYSKEKKIFDNAHFSLNKGDRVCILGENGSGKSTLLKILANIIPCKLDIEFLGSKKTEIKPIIKNIGYIPDKPFLYDELTGIENINFIMNVFNEDKKNYIKTVNIFCEKFKLTQDLNNKVKEYSLGMKHKLFLSCILARDIKLLLLDEPLTALDSNSQKIAIKELEKKSANNLCIIFTSHIKELQKELATKVYLIENQKILLQNGGV